MIHIISILALIASSSSCQSITNQELGSDSLVYKTVDNFYSWYLQEAYPKSTSYYQVPGYKKLPSTSYIFDLDEYRIRLDKIEQFSERYKEKLINQLKGCNEEMLKFEWEYEPEPMFNIKLCNYLWGNQWVGGQGERIDGYNIASANIEGEAGECVVNIMIGENIFVKSIVSLKRIEGEFKITDISLDWKKD